MADIIVGIGAPSLAEQLGLTSSPQLEFLLGLGFELAEGGGDFIVGIGAPPMSDQWGGLGGTGGKMGWPVSATPQFGRLFTEPEYAPKRPERQDEGGETEPLDGEEPLDDARVIQRRDARVRRRAELGTRRGG